MKKTTLILLSPLCLLYANTDRPTTDNTTPQKIEEERDTSMPWSRDDVIKSRDAASEAREKRSQETQRAAAEIANSNDGDTPGGKAVELDDTQDKATILNLQPRDSNKKSSIIIVKPKSIEKPKVEGIQLEVIKKPLAVGAEKKSIVVVTQVNREASAPKVIEVVAINKTTKIGQETKEEISVEGSTLPEGISEVDGPVEVDGPIMVEQTPKNSYPSKFIILRESH